VSKESSSDSKSLFCSICVKKVKKSINVYVWCSYLHMWCYLLGSALKSLICYLEGKGEERHKSFLTEVRRMPRKREKMKKSCVPKPKIVVTVAFSRTQKI